MIGYRRVIPYYVDQVLTNFLNHIKMNHFRYMRQAIKSFLQYHRFKLKPNMYIISCLINGCASNKFRPEQLQKIGGYRFIQDCEFKSPNTRDDKESDLEKFVWDFKALLRTGSKNIKREGRILPMGEARVDLNKEICLKFSYHVLKYQYEIDSKEGEEDDLVLTESIDDEDYLYEFSDIEDDNDSSGSKSKGKSKIKSNSDGSRSTLKDDDRKPAAKPDKEPDINSPANFKESSEDKKPPPKKYDFKACTKKHNLAPSCSDSMPHLLLSNEVLFYVAKNSRVFHHMNSASFLSRMVLLFAKDANVKATGMAEVI